MTNKKKLTLLFIFATTTICQAQIKKGTVLLGAQVSAFKSKSVSYNTSAANNNSNGGASLNISVAKTFVVNKAIGIAITGGYNRSKVLNNIATFDKSYNQTVGANIFYRQYKKLATDFYFFGEAGLGVYDGFQSQTQDNNGNIADANSIAVNTYITPGLSYKLYKKLQLELTLPNILGIQYSRTKFIGNSSNNYENSQFSFSTAISSGLLNNLSVGFRLFI